MKSGDIILIDFPFTIPHQSKVRPALVVTETKDKYGDIVVCAISSVYPAKLGKRELAIKIIIPILRKQDYASIQLLRSTVLQH